MKEQFIHREFQDSSLAIIAGAEEIIEEMQEQGFTLTLRQLFYQFVSRGWLPNTQRNYKQLGVIINNARLAGLIDWDAIEDRTRFLHAQAWWGGPFMAVNSLAEQYREDLWLLQDERVEVWIEKDALLGVIEPICNKWRVPFFSTRGYPSQSALYEAANRHVAKDLQHGEYVILHLTDHDPSGIDMAHDIAKRLDLLGSPAVVERIALTMEQVEDIKPPPNPAKLSDSRARAYISQYGHSSWELDALSPTMIENLLRNEIARHIDRDQWEDSLDEEEKNRERLFEVARGL